jgi:exopolysaccharide biosynthesis WecB/TagA/CpsF family protein
MSKITSLDLIAKIHPVTDQAQLINSLLNEDSTVTVGFINQHGFNLCSDNQVLDSFSDLDVLLRDGIGMKIAMKLFHRSPGENMNGTDLIPQIIHEAKQQPLNVMAFGTEEPWLSDGVNRLGISPQCTAKCHGFEDLSHYIAQFEQHHSKEKLNVVILAMGMPKQERLASEIKALGFKSTVVICGGAILDFQANKVKRAPAIFRQTGLEWAYRLLSEPKRMFGRYVIGIPVFLSQILVRRTQAIFSR